ncbi:MAG: lyase family protein, partial [Phycisphaerales bacterium]|nr:lyase family protein [Phycisphaerales bacterium]
MALWGGRFEGKASPLFRAFNDSLPFDRRFVLEDIEGSIAWSKAIQRAGVIDAADQHKLEAALRELHVLASKQPELLVTADDEDVHSWVERELVARVGDLGKKLHTGRSRNDQVATDLRLWTLKAVDTLIHLLRQGQRSLVSFAAREHEAGTVVPGYTHM